MKSLANSATAPAKRRRTSCNDGLASACFRQKRGWHVFGTAGGLVNDREVRREALSVCLLEFSVLWAVFPLLDQLVEHRPIDARLMSWSLGISLTTLVVGVILRRGERR